MSLRTISNASPRPSLASFPGPRPASHCLQYGNGKLGGGLGTKLGQPYTIDVLCMSLENLCFTKHAPWNKLSSVIFKTSDILASTVG